MTELIEGPWKNFTFKMARREDFDYPKIIVHMRENFMVDEPLCQLMNYDEEELKEMDDLMIQVLDKGISFFAIDNATGEVAGVRMSIIESKAEKQSKSDEPNNPRIRKVIELLRKCAEGEGDVFNRYPDVDKVANLYMASVGHKYRGQGLASEMYRRSLNFFKSQGIPVAKSNFTSPYSRKAALNLGFVELKRLQFLDLKDSDGKPYLKEAKDDQLCTCMAIRLI